MYCQVCVCVKIGYTQKFNGLSYVFPTEIAIRYTLFQTPSKIILLVTYPIISPYLLVKQSFFLGK